jgi:hypothetical protein
MAPANLMVENSVLGNIFVEFIRGFPALGTSIWLLLGGSIRRTPMDFSLELPGSFSGKSHTNSQGSGEGKAFFRARKVGRRTVS